MFKSPGTVPLAQANVYLNNAVKGTKEMIKVAVLLAQAKRVSIPTRDLSKPVHTPETPLLPTGTPACPSPVPV